MHNSVHIYAQCAAVRTHCELMREPAQNQAPSIMRATNPWELTAGCRATTGDTIGLFFQGHMDFSSELYNTHKHISMQQQEHYVKTDINIFVNYLYCLFICKGYCLYEFHSNV